MSVYSMEGIYANETSVEKISAYLYQLNEHLQYMFSNLTAEDNYSEKAYQKYLADSEGNIAELKISLDEIKAEMVTSGSIISAINMSREKIMIQAKRISLEGLVTVNGNFKILEDGSMEAVNGTFSGEMVAESGTIGGFKIEGDKLVSTGNAEISFNSGDFYMNHTGIYIDDFEFSGGGFYCTKGILADTSGNIYVHGSRYYEGWTVADALNDLYGQI
jgi:hypothetical protein